MCARYTMTKGSAEELAEELGVDPASSPPLEPSFNIAPTEEAPIVIQSKEGERRLAAARFGLVPHWAKDVKIGARMLNARSESVGEKPAFRGALARHRCLVAADGFFEWRREGRAREPYYFHLEDRSVFAFAGLWAAWKNPAGEWVTSFTILTHEARGAVRTIHDREPVVLARDAYAEWLDRAMTDGEAAKRLLERHRSGELVCYRVSPRVNYVANDGPELIAPIS